MDSTVKKGKGKNSDKLVGEVVQVDLILLEWFYKKIPFKDLVKYFNISEGTLCRIIKHYDFKTDLELRSLRKSDKTIERTDWKKGKDSKIFKDRLGEKFITKEGYEVEIIDYILTGECKAQFTHDRSFTLKSSYGSISKGQIKNPFHRSFLGVGYMGIGKYKSSRNKIKNKTFEVWQSMLSRCYNENVQKRQPRYKGCLVDEKWHNFQNFGAWYENNFKNEYMEGWCLDKDIVIQDNKIYSEDTCCFVPKDINLLFTKNNKRRGDYPIGVFLDNGRFRAIVSQYGKAKYFGSYDNPNDAFYASKIEKERYIKEVADLWKDKIHIIVYQAMYNYKVKITD